jgi:hypothetical protein
MLLITTNHHHPAPSSAGSLVLVRYSGMAARLELRISLVLMNAETPSSWWRPILPWPDSFRPALSLRNRCDSGAVPQL